MSKGFIFTFAFAIGATAGSVVTWKYVQNKYEQLAREEVEEVRAYYSSKDKGELTKKSEEQSDTDEEPVDNKNVSDEDDIPFTMSGDTKTDYASIVNKYSTNDDEGGDKPMSRREPYVISPAEFGEDDSYEGITLYYYNDGVLADRDGNRIDDIESCIGYESLKHFGEYEEDSVYVRNDDTMMEYEVLLDETDYADLEGID